MDTLLDLFMDDYNVNCHVVIFKNAIDKNGNKEISREFDTKGRFFAQGNMGYTNDSLFSKAADDVESFNADAKVFIPGDIDPTQLTVTDGYVEINGDGIKHKIIRTQKAYIFDEINFTRVWLK
jgi:hypothetical protein